jgi:hypothetical protein
MNAMVEARADLIYDPNDVGPDCVVRCRISSGPRRHDPAFNPQIGDQVVLVDDDGEVLQGRVTDRDGDRVWVQVELPRLVPHSA